MYLHISGVYLLIATFGTFFPILSKIGPEVIVPLECRKTNSQKLHSKYFGHTQQQIIDCQLPTMKHLSSKDLSVSILYF